MSALGLFPHELIIDNFAGGGGTSTGLEQAFGRPVDIAINHDPKALAMHRINHPHTKHYCESVWDVRPDVITNNQPVGLVWLSPDCKHFSKAKGGKPVDKKIRGLAWIALRWADLTRPRVIILENVEEFTTWGRLGPDGKPDPKYKGETFRSFINALGHQGYKVEYRFLRASYYGAPTLRKRLFLIARRDGLPIVWPDFSHEDPEIIKGLNGKFKHVREWVPVSECIDWSLNCPSIFERKKPLQPATLKRIAAGIMRYVINAEKPYIIENKKKPYIAPVLTECANASTPRCMPANEPIRTICAATKGGHHALVSAFLAKNYTGVVGSKVQEPIHTITSQDHHSLVTSNLVKLRNNNVGQPLDTPIHTITASGGHFAEVRAFLTAYYGNERDGNPVDQPLRTIPTKERFGLVFIKGQTYAIADIGFRMLQPHELFKAQGFPEGYIFDRGIDEQGNIVKLNKKEQTRMCGNSVCPQVARALVEANFKHEQKYSVVA